MCVHVGKSLEFKSEIFFIVYFNSVSIYYRLVIGLLGFRPNILVLHILVPHTLLCLYKSSSVY